MKNLLFIALTVILFTACETQEKRYTQQSSEIETVKQHLANYNTENWSIQVGQMSSIKIRNVLIVV